MKREFPLALSFAERPSILHEANIDYDSTSISVRSMYDLRLHEVSLHLKRSQLDHLLKHPLHEAVSPFNEAYIYLARNNS